MLLILIEKLREKAEKDYTTCYAIDLIGILVQGKQVKKLESFATSLKKYRGEVKEDTRTAKEIIADTLELFKPKE